ncbi:MAG: hypothetical protein R2875_14100 [Desulfobacterales bacterium]
MNHTALVLYYTSQNTARLAKAAESAIADCGWEVLCMSLDKAGKNFPDKTPSLIILGTPVHFWTVPSAAMKYIQRLPDLNSCPTFVLFLLWRLCGQ